MQGQEESLCKLTEDYIIETRRKEEIKDARLRKTENKITAIWIVGPALLAIGTALKIL